MCVRGGGGGAHRAAVANSRSLTRGMWNKNNNTDTLKLKRRKMLYKPWRPKEYFQFEIVPILLVS